MREINYSMIPGHCQDGMRAWIERGSPTGGFLTAVLENDLSQACVRADPVNRERLRDYVIFLHLEAPRECHGDSALLKVWSEHQGLSGLERRHEMTA